MRLAYIAAALLWTLACPVRADLIGNVVKIADGDSVTILDMNKVQHKVRLVGIAAPERKQRDHYGRVLGKILINGIDVNLEQIRRGMAWHYKAYKYDQSASDRQTYTEAERKARVMRQGLWIDSDPLPPWVWRKLKRRH